MSCNSNLFTIVLVIIVVILIIWLMQPHKENYGYVRGSNASGYAQLNGAYNTQLFSPCINQKCSGGPYMFSSNPHMISACQKYAPNFFGTSPCGVKGQQGAPVYFDYSSLTSDNWSNKMCDMPVQTSLCSL